MTLPNTTKTRISDLKGRLAKCQRKLERLREAEKFEKHNRTRDEEFIGTFKDTCALVREAELANAPYLVELAEAVGKIIDDGVDYSYGDGNGPRLRKKVYSRMPSWAHDDNGGRPLIKDETGVKVALPDDARKKFIRAFRDYLTAEDIESMKPVPWKASSKRHPESTNLARFRPKLPALTLTLGKPLAASILDARCEITSSQCATPIRFYMSSGNTFLALTGRSESKSDSSVLETFILDQPLAPSATFPAPHSLKPKLSVKSYDAATDEARQLIFVGDDNHIKSYEWGDSSGAHENPLLVHTLDTRNSAGPMSVLPNGSVVRAGGGGVNVWDNQALSAKRNGGKITKERGLAPSSSIEFLDQPYFKPSLWQPLPAAPSTFLCVENPREGGGYSCIGINLEAAKSTSYYLGHGGMVTSFSVSSADPQMFLTTCEDGFARLFDVRCTLPVVTFDVCDREESCDAAALAHPDGIPVVFTGTGKGEQIKLWDVRARACVYELATGNNAVRSLAWDARNNCLYAATECRYMDRFSFSSNYRYARIPKNQIPDLSDEGTRDDEDMKGDLDTYSTEGTDDMGDMEDDDSELSIDDGRGWPRNAWHREDHFGYLFDAGEHRIIRYAFKEDPNPSIVPKCGESPI